MPTDKPTAEPTQPTPEPSVGASKIVAEVSVFMQLTASAAPTSDDEADLKSLMAGALEVEESAITEFEVTSTISSTQRRRLLATYTWTVTCLVAASLTDSGHASVTDFEAFAKEALTSDSFLSAVLGAVVADVDTSSVRINTEPSDDSSTDDSSTDDLSTDDSSGLSTAGILGIVIAAVLLVACALKAKDIQQKRDAQTKTNDFKATDEPVSMNELELSLEPSITKLHALTVAHNDAVAKLGANKAKLSEFLAAQGLQNKQVKIFKPLNFKFQLLTFAQLHF